MKKTTLEEQLTDLVLYILMIPCYGVAIIAPFLAVGYISSTEYRIGFIYLLVTIICFSVARVSDRYFDFKRRLTGTHPFN